MRYIITDTLGRKEGRGYHYIWKIPRWRVWHFKHNLQIVIIGGFFCLCLSPLDNIVAVGGGMGKRTFEEDQRIKKLKPSNVIQCKKIYHSCRWFPILSQTWLILIYITLGMIFLFSIGIQIYKCLGILNKYRVTSLYRKFAHSKF